MLGWLELTGRGNNPDARADAAAHALFTSGSDAAATGEALSALLTLRHLRGGPLPPDADAVLDLADEADPSPRTPPAGSPSGSRWPDSTASHPRRDASSAVTSTGVPWTLAVGGEPYRLALKSGNFGARDFFAKATEMLQ